MLTANWKTVTPISCAIELLTIKPSSSCWRLAVTNRIVGGMAQSEATSSALTLSIQTRVQLLAGFEERSDLAQDIDRRTRSRVPARARLAMPDRERTEATYLDPTAPLKCLANRREDGFDNALSASWPNKVAGEGYHPPDRLQHVASHRWLAPRSAISRR